MKGRTPVGYEGTTAQGNCSRRRTTPAEITNQKTKQNRSTQLKVRLQQLLTSDDLSEEVSASITYDFSSCLFPKFKIMHFQNRDIKLYTVVLLFLCFLKILLK